MHPPFSNSDYSTPRAARVTWFGTLVEKRQGFPTLYTMWLYIPYLEGGGITRAKMPNIETLLGATVK